MLIVIMLNVVMLSAIMLNVVAPSQLASNNQHTIVVSFHQDFVAVAGTVKYSNDRWIEA